LSPDRASPERKPPHDEHQGHAPPPKAGRGTGKPRRASEPLVRPRLCQNCKSLLTKQAGPPPSQPLRTPQLAGGGALPVAPTCPTGLRTKRAAPLTRRRRRARRSRPTIAASTAARGRRASRTSTRALSPRSRAATGECDRLDLTPSHEYSARRQKRRRAAPVSLMSRKMQNISAIVTSGRGAQRRTGRGARALWGVHAHGREEPALLLQQEGGSGAARRSTSLIISECGFSFTSLIATRCGFSFTSLVATQFG
jgi:hypothetical protein